MTDEPTSRVEAVREAVQALTAQGKLSCWVNEDEHTADFLTIRAALATPAPAPAPAPAPVDAGGLVARLEGGERPNRKLDLAISVAVGFCEMRNGMPFAMGPEGSTNFPCIPPCYTTSLDAAVAFVERMLPGWLWSMSSFDGNGNASAYIAAGLQDATIDGVAKSPARALTAAALRALAQKDQDNG